MALHRGRGYADPWVSSRTERAVVLFVRLSGHIPTRTATRCRGFIVGRCLDLIGGALSSKTHDRDGTCNDGPKRTPRWPEI